ncbi:MAG TPA: class D sortase [Terriglobia bacterium]|nr:class D sortase [Terriglobia bacterium]
MQFRIKSGAPLPTRTPSFLRASRYLFFLIGILALGDVGYVLLDAKLYQAYETWRFQQALKHTRPPIAGSQQLHPAPLPSALTEATHSRAESPGSLGRGSPLGRLEINRIGLTVMILEGTDGKTLRRAVGHVRGTPLPGEQGNVAIAGHRDTFFRALRNIRKDDEITLTTLSGSYRYRVDAIQVVGPEDTEVLDDSGEAILTLVTCYPFYLVGPAPQRFVVRAHRISG